MSGDRFSDEQTQAWLSRVPFLAALGLTPTLIDSANVILRKSAHFVEYAVLSMLTYRALGTPDAGRRRAARLAGALALALSVAVLDEVHQGTTQTRTGSPRDVLFDAVGAAAGALVGGVYLYRRGARRQP